MAASRDGKCPGARLVAVLLGMCALPLVMGGSAPASAGGQEAEPMDNLRREIEKARLGDQPLPEGTKRRLLGRLGEVRILLKHDSMDLDTWMFGLQECGMRAHEALPEVVGLLEDDFTTLPLDTIRALLSCPDAIKKELERRLTVKDERRREAALRAVFEVEPPGQWAVRRFLESLRDPSTEVRTLAALLANFHRRVGRVWLEDLRPELLTAMFSEENDNCRYEMKDLVESSGIRIGGKEYAAIRTAAEASTLDDREVDLLMNWVKGEAESPLEFSAALLSSSSRRVRMCGVRFLDEEAGRVREAVAALRKCAAAESDEGVKGSMKDVLAGFGSE